MKKIVLLAMAGIVFSCSKKDTSTPVPDPGDPNEPGNPATLSISSVSPDRGDPSTMITITGTGFNATAAANEVKAGNYNATVVTASATSLVVTLPADMEGGSYDIIVRANNKMAVRKDAFSCIGWMVSTFAGSGISGHADGPAAQARFSNPMGITADDKDNFYLADNHLIRKISATGMVSTYAGNGTRGNIDGPAASASFNFPRSIAVDAAENLYIADQFNHAIRKISPTGDVNTIAGNTNPGSNNGVGAAASFNLPYGIAVNRQGTILYVGDYANHRVRKIDLQTREVSNYAGSGSSSSSDGASLQAGIPWPGGLFLADDGTLYVTERGAGKIRKISATGQVTTVGGYLSVNVLPVHLTADKDKNVYVVYKSGHHVMKYAEAGTENVVFGNMQNSGDVNGPAASASFFLPEGIVLKESPDGKKVFYLCDTGNKKIKKIAYE